MEASLPMTTNTDAERQPASTSRPTSGSRKRPANKRLQETSVVGQRRRTYGSRAMYSSHVKKEKPLPRPGTRRRARILGNPRHGAHRKTKPPPKPQKQKLPDEMLPGDRRGQGAGC